MLIKYKDEYKEVKFDKSDYLKISQYHWRISHKKNKFYVCTGQAKNGGKIIYLHNIVMDYTPDKLNEIDHINGDSLNNKKENLRLISRIHNIQNVSVRCDNNITHIRGVSIDNRFNKYNVDFSFNKTRMYFKGFKRLEEAVYLRFLCELYFLKEFRNTSNDNIILNHISKLTDDEKFLIEQYFKKKI